jgi:hypothetical protein
MVCFCSAVLYRVRATGFVSTVAVASRITLLLFKLLRCMRVSRALAKQPNFALACCVQVGGAPVWLQLLELCLQSEELSSASKDDAARRIKAHSTGEGRA